MAVNLRSVTGELHQKLKMRAAQEGVTIESLCVRFLWWGLDVPNQVGLERLLEKKSEHDTKTCNVYKCGMCAAIKGNK